MKVYYLINSRLPTEKAEGLEAFKLCEALAESAEVVLVRPRRFNKVKGDPFDFYGVKRNFSIVTLPVIDTVPLNLGHISFWLEAVTFAIVSSIYLWLRSKPDDVVYSHDQISIFFPTFFRRRCYYDIHDFPKGKLKLYHKLFQRLAGFTVTNNWKRDHLISDFGISPAKVMCWPNGVELEKFAVQAGKSALRESLGLPVSDTLMGYVGMLKTMSMGKGIDTAIRSLIHLPDHVKLVLIGGRREDVDYYKEFADNLNLSGRVIFCGWVKHSIIPSYLSAFDILVAPFPKTDHYDYYMSPMKIFEYMASNRPIVASNLNSIREVLPADCALLIEPDSETALAAGVKEIMADPDMASKMAKGALIEARKYSWQERAVRIIRLMKTV